MEQLTFIADTTTKKRSPDLKSYRVPKYTIKLVREGVITVESDQIRRETDLYRVAATMLENLDREHLIVVMLDSKSRIIGANVAAVGGLNFAYLDMKSIIKPAILCNACSIALAHNHPSGDCTPSPEDIRLTDDVIAACKMLDINVIDHLVLADNNPGVPMNFISLRERCLCTFNG